MTFPPLDLVQSSEATALADGILQRLNQLPLQAQYQVLDFVEFLIYRHQVNVADQIIQTESKQEKPLWDAAMDEDWLALKAQLALEEG
ncbi:MAG: hypothetical protein AAF959_19690 [Cyanobacteria bacterium P01_D01_bin.56]